MREEEFEKRLKERFYSEFLPKWDFEKVFLEYGKKCFEKRQFLRAKNIFDDILYISPDRQDTLELKEVSQVEFLREKAQKCVEEGKYRDAENLLKEARELRPGDEEIKWQLEEASKKIQVKTYMMPFKLLKNKSPIHKIQIMREDYDRTIELSQKGDYTLVDSEGQVLWQEEHVPFKIDDTSISRTLPSPVLPQTKVISFTDKEGAQTQEMIIRVNRKPDRTILSFRIKKN